MHGGHELSSEHGKPRDCEDVYFDLGSTSFECLVNSLPGLQRKCSAALYARSFSEYCTVFLTSSSFPIQTSLPYVLVMHFGYFTFT